jgi:acetyltransferase-like isoleucine patch superfamily enzyme
MTMAFGLIVYDVLYVLTATGLYGASFAVARRFFLALEGHFPIWATAPASVLAFMLTLILLVGLLTRLLPPLKAGSFPILKSPVFFSWMLRSLLRRILFFPPLKVILFNVNILRFLALRALQAKVAFTANVSNDVDILDPALVSLGPGTVLGGQVFLSPHYMHGNNLVLGRIEIAKGALVANGNLLGPDVIISERAVLKARASIGVGVRVQEGAHVGPCALLDNNVVLEPGARVGSGVVLGKGTQVKATPKASATEASTRTG